LREVLAGHPDVLHIRGLGLMVGIELTRPIRDLCLTAAQDHGVLINVTRGHTIRLLPPLIIDQGDVERIVSGVVGALG
jgi:acetylornithine aminotransferase